MAKRYAKLNWNSTTTYVSAENLNKMDKGIDDCDNAIETLNDGLNTVNNNLNKVVYDTSSMGLIAGATANLTFTRYAFGMVMVKGYVQLATATTVQEAVLTVPTELRPTSSVCATAYSGVGTNFAKEQVYLYSSGKLSLYAETAQSIYWVNFSYAV